MTATELRDCFSRSYRDARGKFLEACTARGLAVAQHLHPKLGRDGEVLAMDVALHGPADAKSLLIVSSACHGVEGYCGSGVQTALLSDDAWHDAVAQSGIAVLYVHALNPYGFSWWRRTTHENVDLNRNFHDFNLPPPTNPGYDALSDAIVPPEWPPSEQAQARLMAYAHEHGMAKLQEALSCGQYDHPDGIFFGGRAPTWSHLTLREVLRTHGTRCQRLGWIDLHTGLGPSGVGERIFACRDDAQALQRARSWWGDKITSIYDGTSSSAPLRGLMWTSVYEECPQAEYTGIALEFGTLPILQMMQALRADQWLESHPDTPASLRQQIKQQMLDAFYVDTPQWKRQILEQSFHAAHGAACGLAVT
jgi:hypothetical protein